jgi:hypothetical protein
VPPELIALINKPVLLIAILFVGALVGMKVEEFVGKQKRADWRRKNAWRWDKSNRKQPKADLVPDKFASAADQLRVVMKADFKVQPLLNKSEARLLTALDKIVAEVAPGWRVMAQVSLGEVLRCEDSEAYACVNSKRVDLLLVDGDCRPLHAIEYQGGAHHQGTAAARDAVKKEALRRAGIGYVEVVAGDTPAELRRVVERIVKKRNGGMS